MNPRQIGLNMQGELQHEWCTGHLPGLHVHSTIAATQPLVMKPRLGKTGRGFAEHIRA